MRLRSASTCAKEGGADGKKEARMIPARALESAYVLVLFGGYAALWRIKRVRQRRATGHDPEVFGRATDPVQRFLGGLARVLTVALAAIVVAHALGLPGTTALAAPADVLRASRHVGLAVGLLGLAVCALAQRQMGASWRVGIDEVHRTALVTSGMYRLVRNPTYLGLYLVNAGLWLIWPTCSVAMFVVAFTLMIEVQVRCEEQHLLRVHGTAYRDYAGRTWRYLPWVY
jgi:protein-S-isoprenylcysteine O-methyltransferase Ste14